MSRYFAPRVIAKLVIAFTLLFALSVPFHGAFGPGAGLRAALIVVASLVSYAVIRGLPGARAVVLPDRLIEAMIALGVLIYAAVGILGVTAGGNYLDYFVLALDPVPGQQRGIFWVEISVLVTVIGVTLKIFDLLAVRVR